ncbi:MAG TPA: SRPBCC family protein [Rhizomicrobium sp.]|nr:SRPBCC family protein [Rhizomicrobium sp.]
MPQVIRTIEIRATPSKVWRFIGTEDALRRWISPNLEIDLQVGGKYRFLGPDNKTWVSGHVMELVPEGWLILSWLEEDQGWIHPARFVIALVPAAAGTKVTIIHDGFAATGHADWPTMVADYEQGSDAHGILDKLAALVNAHAE